LMGTGAEDGCTTHDCMAGFPHWRSKPALLVATRLHLVDSEGRRVCRVAERSRTGQTPRTPAFAGRLVEILRDDGEPRSPRRPDCSLRYPGSPPSSYGDGRAVKGVKTALEDCMARCPHWGSRPSLFVATRFHLVDSAGRFFRIDRRNRTGRTPRTPAFAGRLVEILRDDGEPRSPRRPDCSLRYPGSPPSSRHSVGRLHGTMPC